MMSAKLTSLGLTIKEASKDDATEELATVSSSNRLGSEREKEKQRKSESKRRAASSKERKDLLLLLLPSSTMAEHRREWLGRERRKGQWDERGKRDIAMVNNLVHYIHTYIHNITRI